MLATIACFAAAFAVAHAGTGWDTKFFSGGLPQSSHAFLEDPVRRGTLLAGTADSPPIYDGYLYNEPGWAQAEGAPTGLDDSVDCIAALGQDVYFGGSFSRDWDTDIRYSHILKRDPAGNWSAVITASGKEGFNAAVNSMVVCGGSLFVAGDFTGDSASTVTLNHVTRWDAAAREWVDLAGGVDGAVYALACGPTAGSLWVGGNFNNAGSGSSAVAAAKLAYWSGSAWARVTDGSGAAAVASYVFALASDTIHGGVWVGGGFTACGATASCNRVAFFNAPSPATTIAATGTVTGTIKVLPDSTGSNGVDATVLALYCDANCANLYLGGDFRRTAGGVTMNRIARYTWATDVLSPITDGTTVGLDGGCKTIFGINFGAYSGSILFGGSLSGVAGSSESLGAAVVYNGSSFFYPGRFTSSVGGGLHYSYSGVHAIAIDTANKTAYVGGTNIYSFGKVYDDSVGNLLAWDLTSDVCTDLGFYGSVYGMTLQDGKLYIAGPATAHGCSQGWVYNIAAATISCYKDAAGNDVTLRGQAGTVASTPTTVYLGGTWLQVGYAATNTWVYPLSVVAYDIATGVFSVLPDLHGSLGPGGKVSTLRFAAGALYAGGSFSALSEPSANNVLAWNGSSFSAVLSGAADMRYDSALNALGSVKALAMINGKLHVGGLYKAGNYASNYAVVDPATGVWSSGYTAAGGIVGFNREIRTIIDDGAGGVLLGAGNQLYTDAVSAAVATMIHVSSAGVLESSSGVGTSPSYVVGGVSSSVLYNGETIFVGEFYTLYTTAAGSTISTFASWDGTQLVVPSFLDSTTTVVVGFSINSMVEYQGKLVIGGSFNFVGGLNILHIAMHDGQSGSAWTPVVSGSNGLSLTNSNGAVVVRALAVLGTDLYAAGDFNHAGGIPANGIARWNGSAWHALIDARKPTMPGIDLNTWDSTHKVKALAVFNGELYIGGRFNGAGPFNWNTGLSAANLVKWQPTSSTFNPVGLGLGVPNGVVNALLVANGKLFIGGDNVCAVPTTSANNVARYANGEWSAIAADGTDQHIHHVISDNGVDGSVYSVADVDLGDSNAGTVLLGGTFATAAGGVTATNIASVSAAAGGWAVFPPNSATTHVTGLDGSFPEVTSILQDTSSSVVVVGGTFTHEAGGARRQVNSLVGWSPVSTGWHHVGPSTDTKWGLSGDTGQAVWALAFNPSNDGNDHSLLIGGYGFSRVGGTPSSGIGRLNSMRSLPFSARGISAPTTATAVELAGGLSLGDVAGVVVGVLLCCCCLIIGAVLCRRRRKEKKEVHKKVVVIAMSGDAAAVAAANFSRENPIAAPHSTATATAPAAAQTAETAETAETAAAPKRQAFKQMSGLV